MMAGVKFSILAAAAALAISGCGGSGGGGGGGGGNSQSTTTETVGINQAEAAKLTPFKNENMIDTPLGRIDRSRASVLLADGADNVAFETAVRANGWEIMSFVKPPANAYSIDTKASSVDQLVLALEKLEALSGVVSVDVTREFPGQSVSVDDLGYADNQWEHIWNHGSIDLGLAWDLVYAQNTVPEVNLGVIDRGMNSAHEDQPVKALIAGLGLNGDQNHGMHVAGIMAAKGNNRKGIAGITWANKGSNVYGADMQSFGADEFLNGLERLLSRGVRVINLSAGILPEKGDSIFGCISWWAMKQNASFTCGSTEDLNSSSSSSLALMRQVKKIVEQHERQFPDRSVLFIQSSGNVGDVEIQNTGTYPVSDMNGRFAFAVSDSLNTDTDVRAYFQQRTLIVGAFQQDSNLEPKRITSYSNKPLSNSNGYGFILAPGGTDRNRVYSTFNSLDGYGYLKGTSQAAPHVSGVAGLILQANPSLTASQVRDIILDNSDQVDGYRSLNAYKAVQAAMASGASPIVEAITTKTYQLNDSGKCYYESLPASQIAANEYAMTENEWCLDTTGSQWVSGNGSNVPREILLPSGVWVSEANETFEITGDSTGSVKYGGVAMRAISVSKVSTGWDGTSVNGMIRYELFGDYSYSYVYQHTGSIDALIDTYNINNPNRGGWLSRGRQYAFLFGGSSSSASGIVHIFDPSTGPDWTGPDCANGDCQWTILATGTWTREALGASDVVTVSFPDPYKASFVSNGADDIIYVLKPGDTGVREGDHQLASHRENWSEFTRGAFEVLLQSRGLPPTVN